MDKNPALGAAVRAIRERRDLGLNALADSADLDRATLSKFERGKAGIKDEALNRVCKRLDIKLWQLFLIAEEPEHERLAEWVAIGERMEPDQRAAAVRLFGHPLDKPKVANE